MGLEHLDDLFIGNRILEKQVLSDKLGHYIHWYSYLKLQHLLCSTLATKAMSLQKLTFELLLLKRRQSHRGVLSIIYKFHLEAGSLQIKTYQKISGKDGIIFDKDIWNSISSAFPFHACTVIANCLAHNEMVLYTC